MNRKNLLLLFFWVLNCTAMDDDALEKAAFGRILCKKISAKESIKCLQTIVELGADPDRAADDLGRTPLQLALDHNDPAYAQEAAMFLLNAGATGGERLGNITPLIHALYRKFIGVAQALLKDGKQPQVTAHLANGKTALFFAAAIGDASLALRIIELGGNNYCQCSRQSPSMVAHQRNHTALAALLMKHERYTPCNQIPQTITSALSIPSVPAATAPVLTSTSSSSSTATSSSSPATNKRIRKEEEEEDDDDDEQEDDYKPTAKQSKAITSHDEDLNSQEELDNWLLYAVKRKTKADIVRDLLRRGANVNVTSGFGYTPLFFAASEEIAAILIEAGAKIDVVTKKNSRYESVSMIEHAKLNGLDWKVKLLNKHLKQGSHAQTNQSLEPPKQMPQRVPIQVPTSATKDDVPPSTLMQPQQPITTPAPFPPTTTYSTQTQTSALSGSGPVLKNSLEKFFDTLPPI